MERLGAQDLSMVLPEEFGWPQDIGALGILDGSHLLEADGRFPIEAVRERIGRRLYLLPRFRQLLYTPRRGLGWPLWADAPAFNIAGHVGIGALSYAGQFNITVVADRDGCPDAAVFTEGLQAALDALTQAAPVPS
jgi:wax ester synthase-like acyl-CoA acyltransferase family protein